ncbi:MAG: hypothetical protein PHU25_03710 [Deltaproteobacteria bacterium]|nr:hypothetical protein [Deltaproteobacteria bacterium]
MRGKIILPNLVAVLILGLGGFAYLKSSLTGNTIVHLRENLKTSQSLFDRSEDLRGFELLFSTRAQASSKDVLEAFAPVDLQPAEGETEDAVDKKIRDIWFKRSVKVVEMMSELWSEKTGKRPELVIITDSKGYALARNMTPNACPAGFNLDKSMPVVGQALAGEAVYAIWSVNDSPFSPTNKVKGSCEFMNSGLLELAAAPIWVSDKVAGVLVIGFELSNGTAKKKSEMLGHDVAVIKGGKVYSTSLTGDLARQSLEQQMSQPDGAVRLGKTLSTGQPSDVFEINIEGDPYLAILTAVRSAEAKDQVANVVMASVDKATEDLGALVSILVLMALAGIIVIVAGFLLGNHFQKPVMAIEEGLLKIINGEYSYRFDVKSSEVGGLSYRINQLIGVLTGEEEEQEEVGK